MQKPFLRFLALFRARVLEVGGTPLNTALGQGWAALAPPHCPGVQPQGSEPCISHIHGPDSALQRDQTRWPGCFPGMTTCGFFPLLSICSDTASSLCRARGMPRTVGCGTGRQESSVGKQRGAGRHRQDSWGWREGFPAELASSLLPAARDGPRCLGSSSWVPATATA